MGLKELFFTLLGEELKKEGFEYKKSVKGFLKKDENENVYTYSFEIWPSFIQIMPSFEILIKDIENVKKKAWGTKYRKFVSVGDSKDHLVPKENYSDAFSWTDTEEKVRLAVKKEIEYYNSFVRDYFEKFAQIKFLDSYINKEFDYTRTVAYNHYQTGFLAIIVAKLNNNPKLNDIIEYWTKFYRQDYKEEFELLRDYVLEDTLPKK